MKYNPKTKKSAILAGARAALVVDESQEVATMKWEAEMIEVFKFTRTEIDAFKRITSRMQFLDHCESKGIMGSMYSSKGW